MGIVSGSAPLSSYKSSSPCWSFHILLLRFLIIFGKVREDGCGLAFDCLLLLHLPHQGNSPSGYFGTGPQDGPASASHYMCTCPFPCQLSGHRFVMGIEAMTRAPVIVVDIISSSSSSSSSLSSSPWPSFLVVVPVLLLAP